MSILSNLYCISRSFCETINPYDDDEYRELTSKIEKLEEELFKIISEDAQDMFEEIISIYFERSFVENTILFEKAFSFGAKTVIEVYENN